MAAPVPSSNVMLDACYEEAKQCAVMQPCDTIRIQPIVAKGAPARRSVWSAVLCCAGASISGLSLSGPQSPTPAFKGLLDLDRMAVVGHSCGGATAAAAVAAHGGACVLLVPVVHEGGPTPGCIVPGCVSYLPT